MRRYKGRFTVDTASKLISALKYEFEQNEKYGKNWIKTSLRATQRAVGWENAERFMLEISINYKKVFNVWFGCFQTLVFLALDYIHCCESPSFLSPSISFIALWWTVLLNALQYYSPTHRFCFTLYYTLCLLSVLYWHNIFIVLYVPCALLL